MKLRASLAAVLALVLVVVVAPEATGGGGTPINSCGQTVTINAVLTQDLVCAGSSGVIVGASGITIDLKGFTLRGDGSGSHYGIDTQMLGFDALTVKNGAIVNFNDGINARGGSDNVSVSDVLVSGNNTGIWIEGDFAKIQSVRAFGNYGGVAVTGDTASIKSVNASGNGIWGVLLQGDSVSVKSVTASGNGNEGVYVFGDFAKIQSVTASGNDYHGIRIAGNAALLKANTTNGNGSPDGISDGSGSGIYVYLPNSPTPPVGTKNTALGNDDPAECEPAYLC